MRNKTEKYFITGASVFCTVYGLATCTVPDFLTGFFAGMAAFITYAIWHDDNEN